MAGDAVISAIKMAEDGSDDLIVRVYETKGENGTAVLKLPQTPAAAAYANTHENAINAAAPRIEADTVHLALRAFGVTSVRLRFNATEPPA